ncbi:hypothetical protein [Spiroplasma endosymbiont of Amphibalanus improvisus]|uniref:hypothetical protein n=1 Tax=Spiroplasma endosymbiont of Amphibalanus improvisus TaxID=3066327 RepID=UPI00313CF5AC
MSFNNCLLTKDELFLFINKMLELKLINLYRMDVKINLNQLSEYLLNVVLKDKIIYDTSEAAYYIHNIKSLDVLNYFNNN